MSTRGAIGFRLDGKDYVSYCHSDCYPDGLGQDFVQQVQELMQRADLKDRVRALRLVEEGDKPTAKDIKRARKYTNLGVSNRSPEDWYCLLRNAQGNLLAYLEVGVMIDGASFLLDSLFCEYAYILNLDTGEVEFYKGFNTKPDGAGRYANLKSDPKEEYYGVTLVGTAPATAIPEDWKEQFFAETEE